MIKKKTFEEQREETRKILSDTFFKVLKRSLKNKFHRKRSPQET